MKKVLAVMFAVMFAFSALAVGASADERATVDVGVSIDGNDDGCIYTCDYCQKTFTNPTSLALHMDGTIATENHIGVCDHLVILEDGTVGECGKEFASKKAYEDHVASCGASNWDLCKGYAKMADIINTIKYFIKAVVDFFNDDTVQTVIGILKGLIEKVGGLLGGIDLGGLLDTVKGLVSKIPLDSIGDAIGGIIG